MSMPFLPNLFTQEEISKYNCQKKTNVPGSIFSVDIGSFDQSILSKCLKLYFYDFIDK